MSTYRAPISADLARVHTSAPLAAVAGITFARVLTTWSLRIRTRRALGLLTHQQLQDVGLTPSMAAQEAAKRFWQA